MIKGAKAASSSDSEPTSRNFNPSYTDADALALPAADFGAPASTPAYDSLSTSYAGATGHAAEGERYPSTGPLAGSDPFAAPERPGGYT